MNKDFAALKGEVTQEDELDTINQANQDPEFFQLSQRSQVLAERPGGRDCGKMEPLIKDTPDPYKPIDFEF